MASTVSRVLNRLYTIIIVPIKEKTFKSQGVRLKYLMFKNRSKILVVGFQACNAKGARYNYIRTLKGLPLNRLYIKDDFAANKRGNYYIGCGGGAEYSVEKATYELINKYIDELKPTQVIFIGSSKGGYAALNFGVSYKGAQIIIASPQYYLGSYLANDYQSANLIDIVGDNYTEEDIASLNERLKNKILDDGYGKTQKVWIHYSKNDHTYDEHIKDLLTDLEAAGISLDSDIKDYTVHGELKYYFPDYLRQSIEKILYKSEA